MSPSTLRRTPSPSRASFTSPRKVRGTLGDSAPQTIRLASSSSQKRPTLRVGRPITTMIWRMRSARSRFATLALDSAHADRRGPSTSQRAGRRTDLALLSGVELRRRHHSLNDETESLGLVARLFGEEPTGPTALVASLRPAGARAHGGCCSLQTTPRPRRVQRCLKSKPRP